MSEQWKNITEHVKAVNVISEINKTVIFYSKTFIYMAF